MLRLKLVKGIDLVSKEDNDEENNESSLLHGKQVFKTVVSKPSFGSNRIVCADSYFASVGAAKELYRNGLRFISVFKTATRGFLKAFLTSVELNQHGDYFALASDSELDPAMADFAWMDRERRYFIATTGTLSEGTPYTCCRWRQVSQDRSAPPERVTMTIMQPQIAETYYTTCGAIDRHNWYRQDDLRIETKVETKDWSVCGVNLSIFAMIVVDTCWLVYNVFKNRTTQQRRCLLIATTIGEEKRDDRGCPQIGHPTKKACIRAVESECARAGVLTHVTPVKRLKNAHGEKTSLRYQGQCKECQKKTTWQCSDCNDNDKMVFLCATKNGKR